MPKVKEALSTFLIILLAKHLYRILYASDSMETHRERAISAMILGPDYAHKAVICISDL
jgi:hypothetical protein